MSANGGTTLRALMVLAVVFVAGGAAGVALDRAALRPPQSQAKEPREPVDGKLRRTPVPEDQIPMPLLDLGLSADEEARLHSIARQWRPRAAEEMADVRAKVGGLENGMFADMLCAITPEHRDRYLVVAQQQHMPRQQIDTRFALVRSNQCPAK